MKIAKLKCNRLADTASSVAGKSFVTACRQINTLHQSPEEPTGYLFVMAHNFKNEAAPGPLLVVGDLTADWLKFARALKKTSPKNVLFGECFAEETADGVKIILSKKSGAGKLTALLKDAAVKSLLKKAKTTIDWAKNMSDDAEETPDLDKVLDASTLDDAENDDLEDYLEETDEDVNTAWEEQAEEAFQIKSLLEKMGAAKTPEMKAATKTKLGALIPPFLKKMHQIKGIPPPKLFQFSNDLETLWARWQQPKERPITPEQQAQQVLKELFGLYKALKSE